MRRHLRRLFRLPMGDGREQCRALPSEDSPLSCELRALLDHAERLPELARRECRPADYQVVAQEVFVAVQAGWRIQLEGWQGAGGGRP